MDIVFTSNKKRDTLSCENANIYKTIAKYISELSAPNDVDVETPLGDASFQLVKKGGAFFVREKFNNISINEDCTFPAVYLVMVNPEYNNYKFYKLEDKGDQILATYGRIGASSHDVFGERTHYYPKRMYWIKLMEKLAKGYRDMSDVYLNDDSVEDNKNAPSNTVPEKESSAEKLYRVLKGYSQHIIKESCISTNITQSMVSKTKELLNDLYSITDNVDDFNNQLLKILEVSPRRVHQVKDLLAKSILDFENIINREDSLLMAMEAVVEGPQKNIKANNSFGKIKVYPATEKQKEQVLKHLGDGLSGKVKNIYRVIHPEHKKRFNEYLNKNNIHKVKQLWHGSRNENWLSIIDNGLLLKPNAIITGKMFGDGIYFAPSAMKSWGYTSGHNSYWARGNSDTAFMGLYAVAFGKPLDVTAPGRYTQDILDRQGCNCVYAHTGSYLRNDEIVFYNESAILLNYIVEFNS